MLYCLFPAFGKLTTSLPKVASISRGTRGILFVPSALLLSTLLLHILTVQCPQSIRGRFQLAIFIGKIWREYVGIEPT